MKHQSQGLKFILDLCTYFTSNIVLDQRISRLLMITHLLDLGGNARVTESDIDIDIYVSMPWHMIDVKFFKCAKQFNCGLMMRYDTLIFDLIFSYHLIDNELSTTTLMFYMWTRYRYSTQPPQVSIYGIWSSWNVGSWHWCFSIGFSLPYNNITPVLLWR